MAGSTDDPVVRPYSIGQAAAAFHLAEQAIEVAVDALYRESIRINPAGMSAGTMTVDENRLGEFLRRAQSGLRAARALNIEFSVYADSKRGED